LLFPHTLSERDRSNLYSIITGNKLVSYPRPRFANCYSIHEIVIIWIDDNDIPQHLYDFVGNGSRPLPINLRAANATIPSRIVKVLYALSNPQASKKSLNQRFRPDLVHTETIFSMDDDLQFNCESLEFAFKTANMFPDRLVGFYPRLHTSEDGLLEYRARTAQGKQIVNPTR
jgi:hypothetical protein